MATWNNNPGGAWSDSAQWTPNVVPNAVDAVADFNAVDGSSNGVALFGGPFTVGTLNLLNAVNGGFSFQNGTLVMQSSSGSAQINVQTASDLQPDFFNNGTLQLNSNTIVNTVGSATFSSLSGISGTGGLEKTGTGTMTLGGTNTYGGLTLVNGGILNLVGSTAGDTEISGGLMILGSGADLSNSSTVSVSGTGTLAVNSNDTVATVNQTGGLIEGGSILTTGTFNQSGGALDGILVATGTKTLIGGTISGSLQGGGVTTVQTGTTTVFGTILGDVTIAPDGTLRIASNTAVSGTIFAAGAAISYADAANEDSDIVLTATGTDFEVLGGETAEQSGVISQTGGSMGLNKTGTGTLTLTGANTYGGVTHVIGGTLVAGHADALSDLLRVSNAGSTLDLGGNSVTAFGVIIQNGTISNGTLTVTGNSPFATQLGDGGTISANVAGAGGITVGGAGTNTLSGNNTYTGQTIVNAVLSITSGTALGSTIADTVVNSGGVLQLSGGITVVEAITLNGTGVANGGALRNISGFNVVSGAITLANAARINTDADQMDITAGITGTNTNLTVGGSGTTIINSNLDIGTGMLTKDGSGILALDFANSFTGETTVNAGSLQVKVSGALSETGLLTVNAPGFVQLFANETVGNLAGSGGIFLEAAGLTLTAGDSTATSLFSGEIGQNGSDAANFTKQGTGTLTLSGTNTYTGITDITGGTLALSGTGSLSNTLFIRLGTGTTFDISGTTTGATIVDLYASSGAANVIMGGKSLTMTGVAGTLGPLTFTGGAGTDALSITLASTLETFSLAGVTFASWTANVDTIRLTGNALMNSITGNSDNNILDGGVDIVVDTLIGDAGNDTYVLGAGSDIVNDTSGMDTIQSSISRNLAFYAAIENLTLTGAGNINGTGNALANRITGNGGNNILNGGTDSVVDTLIGGTGNDTYVLGAGSDAVIDASGVDTLTSSISRNLAFYAAIENLALTDTGNINGTGNALVNRIVGNIGNNILNGGTDSVVDTLIGGAGNDTYALGAGGDAVIDASGVDTLTSSISRNLAFYAAIENLALTETGNINGTGNALVNRIVGNVGNNILNGGTDSVVDTLIGGAGNDTYMLGDGSDAVNDTSGTDTIQSSISRNLAFYSTIENLVLTGTGNINGIGNALANRIVGNTGNNALNGGLGSDILTGGAGLDSFVFTTALSASNIDLITDYNVANDTIRIDNAVFAALGLGNLAATAFASNTTGLAGDATDRIIYESDTGRVFYDADGLGGAAGIHFATLTAGLALTQADFVVF